MSSDQAKFGIPVGISACLMGEKVRFNGGHKQSRLCLHTLSKVFEYRPYCPEVAIGMSIPREPIRMVGDPEAPRVVGTRTPEMDVTDALFEYGQSVGRDSKTLSGYILMAKSPSCGVYSAKVYQGAQAAPGGHQGMFVRGLIRENPLLPLEEEGRLNDALLRENFVAKVHVYHDWRTQFMVDPTPKALVAFHSKYKFMVMAHGQQAYKQLGAIVAEAGLPDFEQRVTRYITCLLQAFKKPASRKGHVNALYHILGYLNTSLDHGVRADLNSVIDSYRQGYVSLSVPTTMLKHYLRRYGSAYINQQAYLNPYSEELGLQNAI